MFLSKFKQVFVLAVIFSAALFTSCDNDDTPPNGDIIEVAEHREDLSIFVTALHATGLADELKKDGPFTVFAPNNKAFEALLSTNPDWEVITDIPENVLSYVLLFHVLNANVMSEDLSDTYVNTLTTGPNDEYLSLQVQVTDGVKFNGSAMPVEVDVEASNGVIHIIDSVMLPPNIVNLALNNANFSILVAALTDSRHTTDFIKVLSAEGPYTVFAPTNDAFIALLNSNDDWNSLEDIPIEVIDAVLKYHVVAGANVQSDELSDNQEITMLDGNMVTVDLSSGAKLETGSNQSVNIIAVNVQGSNGVIHAVDQVLLP